MSDIPAYVYAAVKMMTDQLTDLELNYICMVALMGSDHRQVQGYERAAPLFTEANGTKMHAMGLDALVLLRDERLENGEKDSNEADMGEVRTPAPPE